MKSSVRVFWLTILLLSGSKSAFSSEELSIAMSVDGTSCTFAASDEVTFKAVRSIVASLKTVGVTEVKIGEEQPLDLPKGSHYLAIKWSRGEQAQIVTTGNIRLGFLKAVQQALAESDLDATVSTISVLPDPEGSEILPGER